MARLESITLKQLRALRAVAEFGSITAAAEILSLTPPAVHTQLRTLEQNLDCTLLDRSSSGGAQLTNEGRAVLDANITIESALEICSKKLRAYKEGRSGLVMLGVVSTGKYFAPQLVAQLRTAFPDIEVSLKVSNRDGIITALQQRTIELAIMGRPPRTPSVTSEPIGEHPHVMIASPDHPLAGQRGIAPQALLDQTFIAREQGSGTRILMTRYLDRIGGGTPYRLIEMESNETIKQAVIANLGVAMISQHTVTEELRSGRLVALDADTLPIRRQWYLLHRADLELSPTLQSVFGHISDQKGAFLPQV
ncbi:LysR family transcriptional regulator [Alisedimentitalea sp. MJ-SS2]|uniref:LysR family regulator CbbR n=1 Tax=Aliisedimentitalea sp. MJ-SS2 TaxID=3049795 RepID=UPI0029061A1E|nr:LysR family transcriptional regulator [Alisedimentitalea sp. MJ-SS2]MDU8928142.1 LysR family transcriptional regulator [Alisedimentitalea sp. MJ-SS2]